MKRWLVASVAVTTLCVGIAWAQVGLTPSPLQPVPNGLNVSVLRPTAVNIKWVVTGGTPGARGLSTVGHFVTGTPTAGTIGTAGDRIGANCIAGSNANVSNVGTLNSSVAMTIGANGVGRAVETLIIPASVSQRVLQNKQAVFFYCRTFAGTGTASTAANVVTCKQGSSAYANFSIARVELFFENRRHETTVPVGTPNLKVYADVAYNGSGLLRAVWEVAEAQYSGAAAGTVSALPSTFTNPNVPSQSPQLNNFRTLHVINRFLGFGDRVLLTLPGTPPLPTSAPGAYDVNLRFIEPAVPFAIPVARYFVEGRDHPRRIATIGVQVPADGARLAPRPFDFRWEGVPNVSTYRIDVYPTESTSLPSFPGLVGSPSASPTSDASAFNRGPREGPGAPGAVSALIPAQMTSFTLRPSQLAKLAPGASYAWRIRGLDAQGNIVAESAMRQFTLEAR
ncbi:MAG: hypothetical protein A3E31_04495 [Candidatus Rokubacteria bacterium RIFCSPHIGHO2_12_FULL_73_22]|nr:MAG: hypothetical protein A3D33_06260 [Candidatus Rokubacteria bacterium RIFCSPHIGHO2_02_FULL_73_26]OGL03619.1 MAG: hypothetical protein A3E31_04495 [Candidatus Rokubacteria bacterium RIFCSPHIGHO2_12_FULL_73_22]OGL29043.1 MAG: hypothetical protein A3G44_19290 [Candidatus Rokubacteria bacterium RIFCSPLOWO2_12_FULL_73_47]